MEAFVDYKTVERTKHFANFYLAGFSYYDGALVFNKLKIGTTLKLVREMNNRYDADAVAIYYESTKLGYIPQTHNSTIALLCEMGYSDIFEVRINRRVPDAGAERQIGVAVHIINKLN